MYWSECGKEVVAEAKFCRACGAPQTDRNPSRPPPLPPVTEIATPSAVPAAGIANPEAPIYANFGQRLLAFLIDLLVFFGLSLLISGLSSLVIRKTVAQAVLPLLATVVSFWLYKSILESSPWQATLGKRALGIKVTTRAGTRIGFGRATGRLFAQAFSYCLFCFGYLMAAFTPRRQALHDYIAGSLVTRRDRTSEEIAEAGARAAPAGSGIIVAVVVGFLGIGIIGILAAIAIPAYQNYTIRAQVTDALAHADRFKSAVSESLAAEADERTITTAPGGIITLDPHDAGRYAESIDVKEGVILITFGGQTHQRLTGRHLALYPVAMVNGDVLWGCGLGAAPAHLEFTLVLELRRLTDVAEQYLPSGCHQ